MSSCLILQQCDSIFMASDTAISSTIGGERVRLSSLGEKLITKDKNIIFCSGNVKLANKCKDFILDMEDLDIKRIKNYVLKEYNLMGTSNLFELFIATTKDEVTSYQLSSYNSFEVVKRNVDKGQTQIFALGYKTESMLRDFEVNLKKDSLIKAMRKSFNDNVCVEIGGSMNLRYFHNGELRGYDCILDDNITPLTNLFNPSEGYYIMAEQLLGQIILSEEVYVGNADNTFKILPEGLYVYDQNSSHELRVFLGIKDGKAKLELYSASGDNSLVLSENGIYSCYQISDRDSFDYYNSFKSHFYVPSTLEKTFEAKLVVRLEKFRAYSKASQSEKIDLKSTESEKIRLESTESEKIRLESTESEKIRLESTNTQSFAAKSTVGSGSISVNVSGVSGGSTPVTVSGSGKSTSQSYNFTTGTHGGVVSGTTSAPYGSANGDQGNIHMESHYHWFKLSHSHDTSANCGQHAHSITISGTASANNHTHDFTVPTHSHTITMPSHSHSIVMPSHSHSIVMPSHSHSIVMPPHGHELEYGIFEHGVVPNCRVYLNGVDLGITMNQEREYSIDITNQFKALQKGLNTIEIKTTDAKGLCRASFTMFWGGYFSYH